MTDGTESELLSRYRSAVDDMATPLLDEKLKAAAMGHAANRRFVRGASGAFFVTALAALASIAAWHWRDPIRVQPSTRATNYGAMEDITRPYLLRAGTIDESRPGALEGMRP